MIELSLSPLGLSGDLVVISFVRFVDLADLLVLPPVSVLVTSDFVIVTPCSCVGCGVEYFSDVVEDVTVVEVIGDFVEELVLAVEELVVDEDTIVGVPAVSVVSGPGVLTFFVD